MILYGRPVPTRLRTPVSAAEHAGRRDAAVVRKRAEHFVTKVKITYAEDGSVNVDARDFLDASTRKDLLEEESYMVVAPQIG